MWMLLINVSVPADVHRLITHSNTTSLRVDLSCLASFLNQLSLARWTLHRLADSRNSCWEFWLHSVWTSVGKGDFNTTLQSLQCGQSPWCFTPSQWSMVASAIALLSESIQIFLLWLNIISLLHVQHWDVLCEQTHTFILCLERSGGVTEMKETQNRCT